MAIMIKNTGKERDREARASVEINPPKKVSTALYMVLKKKPTLAGTVMSRIKVGMGSAINRLFSTMMPL